MSKYTKEEQEFLDKAAIAYVQAMTINNGGTRFAVAENAYTVAKILLTERKKLFGDE